MSDSQLASKQNFSLDNALAKAIALPGVKVNRREFLASMFAKEDVDINKLLAIGSVEYGCSRVMLKKKAAALIRIRTSQSSIVSFLTGLPGSFAMVASIPADVL